MRKNPATLPPSAATSTCAKSARRCRRPAGRKRQHSSSASTRRCAWYAEQQDAAGTQYPVYLSKHAAWQHSVFREPECTPRDLNQHSPAACELIPHVAICHKWVSAQTGPRFATAARIQGTEAPSGKCVPKLPNHRIAPAFPQQCKSCPTRVPLRTLKIMAGL